MDRISLLPDCLLHEILSFVDSKSVVQTCVLSKRWKTLWTEIPTLNFNFHSQESNEFSPKRFVCGFLSQHRSNFIKKLSFSSSGFLSQQQHGSNFIKILSLSSSIHSDETFIVDVLLRYARQRTVEEIHLNTFNTLYAWSLSFSTSSSSVNMLKIKRRFYHNQATFSPSLKFLKLEFLDFVFVDPLLGELLFSDSPNLESLVLVNYFCHCRFRISAPKLQNFELFSSSSSRWELRFPELNLFAPSLKSVKFINILPTVDSACEFLCIHEVNIAVHYSDFDGEDDSALQKLKASVSQLLRVFHNAKSFTLPLKAMEGNHNCISELGLLLDDIKRLVAVRVVSFIWCCREGNGLAHELARIYGGWA